MQYFRVVQSDEKVLVIMSGLYEYDTVNQVSHQANHISKLSAVKVMENWDIGKFHPDVCLDFYVGGVKCSPVMNDGAVVDIVCSDTDRSVSDKELFELYVKKPEGSVTCYQCDKRVEWLAPDGRCGACTGYTPEMIRGEL